MERKLAAILAADVTGCGWMMERDEEGVLDALRSDREVVEGFTVAQRRRAFSGTAELEAALHTSSRKSASAVTPCLHGARTPHRKRYLTNALANGLAEAAIMVDGMDLGVA